MMVNNFTGRPVDAGDLISKAARHERAAADLWARVQVAPSAHDQQLLIEKAAWHEGSAIRDRLAANALSMGE